MNILENISLKNYNTFGLEVNAHFFAEIQNNEGLKQVLSLPQFKNSRKLILGGGSNLLLTKDFEGLVIKISIQGIKILNEDDGSVFIEAGAGVVWNDLVLFCVKRNYGGIENLALIPGTVGAAPVQNIGAYGQELKNAFHSLNGISIEDLSEKFFNKSDCNFGYRDSIFKNELKGKFIITAVKLKLSKNPELNLSYGSVKAEIEKFKIKEVTIRDIAEVISGIRRNKLPDPSVIGNVGSFFKNPEVNDVKYIEIKKNYPDVISYKQDNGKYKIAAAWMIEKAGWKGKRLGNAGVHSKQSLVLVNYGNAKGTEILNLAEEIKQSVKEKFGISLTEEVNII